MTSQKSSLLAAARQDAQDTYMNPFATLSDDALASGGMDDEGAFSGDFVPEFGSSRRESETLPEFGKTPQRSGWLDGEIGDGELGFQKVDLRSPRKSSTTSSTAAKKSKKSKRRKSEPVAHAIVVEPAPVSRTHAKSSTAATASDFEDFLGLFSDMTAAPAPATASVAKAPAAGTSSNPFAAFDDGFFDFDEKTEEGPSDIFSTGATSKAAATASSARDSDREYSLSDMSKHDDSPAPVAVPAPIAKPKRGTKSRASAPAASIAKDAKLAVYKERERGVDPSSKGVGFRVREDALARTKSGRIIGDESSSDSEEDSDSSVLECREAPDMGLAPTEPAPAAPTSAAADVSVAPAKQYNVLPELKRGTALLKYGARGYPHFRQFNLSQDNTCIVWFTHKKKLSQSRIDVKDIDDVISGQHTKEFKRIGWVTLAPASFSILYNRKKKSLSLVAKSVDEMKMWTKALRKLRDMRRRGQDLSLIRDLTVDVDFRDRNRPTTRKHAGKFLRGHETKTREVDSHLHKKLLSDVEELGAKLTEVNDLARHEIIMKSFESTSIIQILSELEERIDELRHEVSHTRNTKIAENDVWRTRIDLESLREKIQVLIKEGKKSKRRWSIF